MYAIAVGSDHAGYALKQLLADELRDLGHEVLDPVSYTHLRAHETDS